jgi:hypothetical protein
MHVNNTQLVEAFSDNVGTGKAEEIVETAAKSAGVGAKRRYSKEEALEVAESVSDLDDVSRFVRISANTVKTRIRSGSL